MSSDSDLFGDGDQPMQDIPGEAEHVEDVGDQRPIPQINFPSGSEPSSPNTPPSIWQDLSSRVESALARRVRQLADQIVDGEELLRQILLLHVKAGDDFDLTIEC
ncbi:hypothetical protein PV11_03987 [Exophiala sideris]|uniref:Uncharacterized protein n=1 Tax=Exophiala sideris TaxID=1016849 RepID=A0A0D1X2M8_9EURO|nr:hypothetical protein PV11_03987 [Exophiala sideris]